MVQARRQAEWARAAWICHVIVNANPWRDGPPVTPDQCNPLQADAAGEITRGINALDPGAVAEFHDALKLREARRT